VTLTGENGFSVHLGVNNKKNDDPSVHLQLISPFTAGVSVGELTISMREELVDMRASKAAWSNAAMLIGYTLFVALLVFLLIQHQFISGIKHIALDLKRIVPGQNERLVSPLKHQHDEIGGLVENINQLLGLVQRKLDSERAMLLQMESLEKQFRMIYERG
jgi:hypothetical protein